MAIAVGDVVELGLSLPNGEISKVLGLVEAENGDQIQVFTGVPPVPHREVPRVSVRRVWPASLVQWEVTDFNNFNVAYTNLGKRVEKKRTSSSRANDNESDAADQENERSHVERSRTVNPLRWLCGALDSIRLWKCPTLTILVMSCVVLWATTQCSKRINPIQTSKSQITVALVEVALFFAVSLALAVSTPATLEPSPLWMYALLAGLCLHCVVCTAAVSVVLGGAFVLSCFYARTSNTV
ncbi:hypothetical protein ADEAN_000400600 [Angomonas deanei]|uniref:Uncharacterized protein n=1 Tax=Angomonas deanei TaxID=59799 RepID=A0A7G2CC96_9TRYP|nr:hypothetical protein ADEAN_000400600 [Angomonas deanei]